MYLSKTTINGKTNYYLNNNLVDESQYLSHLNELFYNPISYLYLLDRNTDSKNASDKNILQRRIDKDSHHNPNTILSQLKNITNKNKEFEEKVLIDEEQRAYSLCIEAAKKNISFILFSPNEKVDKAKLYNKLKVAGFELEEESNTADDYKLKISGW